MNWTCIKRSEESRTSSERLLNVQFTSFAQGENAWLNQLLSNRSSSNPYHVFRRIAVIPFQTLCEEMVVIHSHIKSNTFYKKSVFNYTSWSLFLKSFACAHLMFSLTFVLLVSKIIESVKCFCSILCISGEIFIISMETSKYFSWDTVINSPPRGIPFCLFSKVIAKIYRHFSLENFMRFFSCKYLMQTEWPPISVLRDFINMPQALRSRGDRGGVSPPQSYLLMCPFLLMNSLNMLFLKEVTKNVHKNWQAKSQAS